MPRGRLRRRYLQRNVVGQGRIAAQDGGISQSTDQARARGRRAEPDPVRDNTITDDNTSLNDLDTVENSLLQDHAVGKIQDTCTRSRHNTFSIPGLSLDHLPLGTDQ